jgi:diadenosine tetraphosphatase ApaH/serine/threonine PP2A family protein phosphatase
VRYAILSDIHANLEALDAVLADARAAGATRILCLGDMVGYNADPDACIARLREAGALCISGNHDRAVTGALDPADFGAAARRAVRWTQAQLSPEGTHFLAGLPQLLLVDGLLLVHGALHPHPNDRLHLSTRARVRSSLRALQRGRYGERACFFGHTHRQAMHEARPGPCGALLPRSLHRGGLRLRPGESGRYLINPGSVGQPRDGDPRAAYALYDSESSLLLLRRVPYDTEACRRKAARAGLIR